MNFLSAAATALKMGFEEGAAAVVTSDGFFDKVKSLANEHPITAGAVGACTVVGLGWAGYKAIRHFTSDDSAPAPVVQQAAPKAEEPAQPAQAAS